MQWVYWVQWHWFLAVFKISPGNTDLEESCPCYAGFCVLFPAIVCAGNFKQEQSRHQLANTERPHNLGLKPGIGGGGSARKRSVTTLALLPSLGTEKQGWCRHSLSKYTHCLMTFSTWQVQTAELCAMETEITANQYWAGCGWNYQVLVLSFSWNNDFLSCQEAIWQVPSCGFPQKCWLEREAFEVQLARRLRQCHVCPGRPGAKN